MGNWMRWAALAGAATAAGAVGIGVAGEPRPDSKAGSDRFVVHEWGTFTSMQGADGVALEGLTREDEALPGFVYSRSKVRDCPLRERGWKGLEVPAEHVTQKMETPVLYFHSATARKVRVRVDFVKGLLSQWYPVSDLLGPPEGARDAGPLDLSKVERSFLQWDVEILPPAAARPGEVPAVEPSDPWSFAREVDANWVRTLPRRAPERAGPVEAERYLFYRGLGAFGLPLSATVERGGRITLRNSGDDPIPPATVLQVEGSRGQIVETPGIPAHGEVTVALHGGAWWGPVAEVEEKLKVSEARRLVAAGLREDEARAMVRTWSRSWYRNGGTRVLWIVPRPVTDALLPLVIDPKPDDLVRVLVGRLEIITPEAEADDYAALLDTMGDAKAAARGMQLLDRRGRFLEPHLRNVLAAIARRAQDGKAYERDAEVRTRAEQWMMKMSGDERREILPR